MAPSSGELTALQSRVRELEAENDRLRKSGGMKSGGGGAAAGDDPAASKKQMKEFAANQRDFERERASLQMRAMQAEEELKNFQQFLQTESMKKEQLIATLKKEVAMWKAKAGS
jgi:hypothetical protein